MKVEELRNERMKDFIEYCGKHRKDIDDSFLYDEDLKHFKLDVDNPTYIISNQNEEIIAAASLIMDDYNRRGKRARFRIFHSEINEIGNYHLLLQELLKHTVELEMLYIFVPFQNDALSKSMEGLNFSIERHSYLLVRDDLEILEIRIPKEYSIRSFRPGHDEQIWVEVRNAGFANLKGNETPATKEMVKNMITRNDYLEGGMKILFHHDKPVGIVRGAADEYEDEPIMNIGPVAILPEYQGKGLGRLLLRASLQFAKENSYNRTILSVNGENDRAKSLYIQEGFKEVESVTCYQYIL